MKAKIKKTAGLSGKMVWELFVEAENNVESEELRWWFEQNHNNQGLFITSLNGKYPYFENDKEAVSRVSEEINQTIQELKK
jgi:hypothetical protein